MIPLCFQVNQLTCPKKKPAQSKKNRKTAKTEPTSTQTEPTTDAPPPRRSARLRAQSPAVASNANAVTSAPPARSASKTPAPAQEVQPEAAVQDEAPPVAPARPARPVTPPARSAGKRASPSPETLRRFYGSAALDAVNHDGYESDESSLIPEPIINKSPSPSPEILRLIMGNKAAAAAPAPLDDDGYESDQSSVYPEPVIDVRKDFDAGEREEHAMLERRAARLKAQQDKTADRYANARTSAPPARSASKSPAPAQEIQPEITVHDEARAVGSVLPSEPERRPTIAERLANQVRMGMPDASMSAAEQSQRDRVYFQRNREIARARSPSTRRRLSHVLAIDEFECDILDLEQQLQTVRAALAWRRERLRVDDAELGPSSA